MDLTHVIAERENKKIYRDGAKAIKVFAEGYSKADILNEALNTARVEETGLPIPKLLAVDTVNGQWAITTEFVEGDTLAALMAASMVLDSRLNCSLTALISSAILPGQSCEAKSATLVSMPL